MDQESAAGMVPSPALPPNPYNTEFPDHIANPPLPPNPYNERFSDLVERPPREALVDWGATTGPGSSLPPAPGYDVGRGITTPNLEDALRMRQFYARERLNAPVVDVSGGVPMPMRGGMPVPEGLTYREAVPFSAPAPAPDPGRAARVEQLIRDMEEQEELEARLRALGR